MTDMRVVYSNDERIYRSLLFDAMATLQQAYMVIWSIDHEIADEITKQVRDIAGVLSLLPLMKDSYEYNPHPEPEERLE